MTDEARIGSKLRFLRVLLGDRMDIQILWHGDSLIWEVEVCRAGDSPKYDAFDCEHPGEYESVSDAELVPALDKMIRIHVNYAKGEARE